jgi:type I restriction enzyme R subunit
MYDMAVSIFNALEPDNYQLSIVNCQLNLPPFIHVNDPNTERKALVALLANNPQARKYLLVLNAGFVKILIPGEDELIYRGFSQEEATSTTQAFEAYINNHKDEIEALRIIYNNQDKSITYSMLHDLKEKLLATDSRFNHLRLWNYYSIVSGEKVIPLKTETEREAITNLIQLVRYAFHLIPELKSLPSLAAQRFPLWCGQIQRPLTVAQEEIMKQIVGYIVANGAYSNNELREESITVFAQLVHSFGSADAVDEVLGSLSGWMLKAG